MVSEYPWDGLKVEEEIGEGAFGTVYRVNIDGHIFAMKYVRIPQSEKEAESCARRLGGTDKAKEYYLGAAERLMEKTKILQRFKDHPNIVSIQDYKMVETEIGFDIFILMECLKPLSVYQTTHVMDEKETLNLGIDICSALAACEKESIIHRDLKTDNILVTEDRKYKICDFGVAKNLEKTFTENSVKGTFTFMAPEVYHGQKYNNRADIYSLGMIMYCIMNRGKEPFLDPDQRMIRYKDKEDALNRRMNGDALPAPVDASAELAEIILKACAYYPEKRYASAEEMKKDLLSLQSGTYKKKNKDSRKYGKRTRSFYLKAAVLLLLAVFIATAASKPLMYMYRENCVDLCDADIKEALREDYGITSTARLSGNGTLYIESNEDVYRTRNYGAYPWMNHKDEIKKIVFGENVTQLPMFNDYIHEETELGVYTTNESDVVNHWDSTNELFAICPNLTEIVIKSSSLQITELDPFEGDTSVSIISCPSDADIHIEGSVFGDTAWINEEGYRMLGTTLMRYNGSAEVLDDIPENTKRLNANCIKGNDTVKKIILPEGLVFIDGGAFVRCSALEEIQIPGSVELIEYHAFIECSNLRNITLSPDNKAYVMDNGVLYDAAKTTLLWGSPEIEGELAIPDTVETIFYGALDNCSSITGLIIPDSVQTVDLPFPGHSPELYSITVSGSNPIFTMEEGIIYSKDGTYLFFCPRDQKGMFEVPDGITYIKEYSFASCTDMTEIRLPDTLIAIMDQAFEDCTGLKEIVLPRQIEFIAHDVFKGCDSLTDIYYEGTEEEWEMVMSRAPRGIGIDEEKTIIHFLADKEK